MASSDSITRYERFRTRAAFVLVALLWLYVFPYSVSLNNPNERTRLMQTRALAEYGMLEIGEAQRSHDGFVFFTDLYGAEHLGLFLNDVALVCHDETVEPPDCSGWLYPAKAPGAVVAAYPATYLSAAMAAVPPGPPGESKATWLARYTGVALPAFLALMALWSLLVGAGLPRRLADRVVIAGGLGTILFPYAILFAGHALASACLLLAVWAILRARDKSPLWSIVGGFLAGFAVFSEYHAALAALCIGAWVVATRDWLRRVVGFTAGGLAAVALHFAYHDAMYGSGLKTGHFFLASEHNRTGQGSGFLGIDGFHLQSLHDHLLDPYMGLAPLMPWLAVGLLAGIPVLLRGGVGRLPNGLGRTLAAIVLLYLLFVTTLGNWRVMNGWSIGPRYLVPAIFPMLFCAGVGWHRMARIPTLDRLMGGLAAASIAIVGAITITCPSPPNWISNTFADMAVPLLGTGRGVRSAGLFLGLGEAWLVPVFALAGGCAVWVVAGRALKPIRWWHSALTIALGCLLAFGWTYGMSQWTSLSESQQRRALTEAEHIAEGWHPDRDTAFFP